MTKREVSFFREKRHTQASDIVTFLRELGYSDERIKDLFLKAKPVQDAQKIKQDIKGKEAQDA